MCLQFYSSKREQIDLYELKDNEIWRVQATGKYLLFEQARTVLERCRIEGELQVGPGRRQVDCLHYRVNNVMQRAFFDDFYFIFVYRMSHGNRPLGVI